MAHAAMSELYTNTSFTSGPERLTKAIREVDLPLPGTPLKMLGLRLSRRLRKVAAMSPSKANVSTCVRKTSKSFARNTWDLYSMPQGTWNHVLWPMQQMGSPSLYFWLHEGRLHEVLRFARMMLQVGCVTAKQEGRTVRIVRHATVQELGCKVHGSVGHGWGAALTARRKIAMVEVADGAQREVGHVGSGEGSCRTSDCAATTVPCESVQSGGKNFARAENMERGAFGGLST